MLSLIRGGFGRLSLLALVFGLCMLSGQGFVSEYYVRHEVTLSSATEAVTVQIPANTGRYIRFKVAQVWCSTGSVNVTIERDGAAATATALTVRKVNPSAAWVPPSAASAFSASDVGAGTQVGATQTCYGGTVGLPIDMSSSVLEKDAGGVRNLTIRLASYTGSVRIFLMWEERSNL